MKPTAWLDRKLNRTTDACGGVPGPLRFGAALQKTQCLSNEMFLMNKFSAYPKVPIGKQHSINLTQKLFSMWTFFRHVSAFLSQRKNVEF